MTKSEHLRLTNWRLKILRRPRVLTMWRAPAGMSAFPERPSTSGASGTTSTVMPDWRTGPGRRTAPRGRRRRRW